MRRGRLALGLALGLLSGTSLAGCGLLDAPQASVARVDVRPQAGASLQVGQSFRLKAIANVGSRPVPAVSATWTSSAPDVVRVDADGTVTAVAPGDAVITADVDGTRGQTALSVLSPFSELRFVPDSVALFLGQRARVLAVGLSSTSSSSISQPGVADVLPVPPVLGVLEVTARAPGRTTFTMTSGGQIANLPIRVTAPPAGALLLSDPFLVLRTGTSAQLGLAAGVNAPPGGLTWTSTNAAVAEVTPAGRVDARTPGTAYAVARAPNVAGLADSALVMVLAPAPSSVLVNPGISTLAVGASESLTVAALDQTGRLLFPTATRWLSRTPAVAAVSRTGVVTGIAPGKATIVAEVEIAGAPAVTGSATVTVSRDARTLTMELSGTGSGSIGVLGAAAGCSRPPGVGPTTCTLSFSLGEVANLVAAPLAGARFDGWSGACTGAQMQCTVTMTEDRTVRAAFTAP